MSDDRETPDARPEDRAHVPTLVRGLDAILQGGLLPGRLYVLSGMAGTGKTVLASEIAFRRAREGDAVVYVTALNESLATLVENLSSFDFFDRALVGTRVTLLSASQPLKDGSLDDLIRLLVQTVRQTRASILAVDSLSVLESLAPTPEAFRRFVFELGAIGSVAGCTVIATVTSESPPARASATMVADGVFELSRSDAGLRAIRAFQVVKYRGSPNLEGKHLYTIEPSGVALRPRREGLPRVARTEAEQAQQRSRCSVGVANLDEMLHGGVLAGSTTAILGAPGSGKTLLGLHFLSAGAARGEPGLYYGFYERPERLLSKADGVGLPLRSLVRDGAVEVSWRAPTEAMIDEVAEDILEAVDQRGVRRVVFDGVDGLSLSAAYRTRLSRFLTALGIDLRARCVTTFMTEELGLFDAVLRRPLPALSAVFENILLLRYLEVGTQLHRFVSIVKTRESDYDASVRELHITSQGIGVAASSDSAARVLRDSAEVATRGRQPGEPRGVVTKGRATRPRGARGRP